MIKMTEYANRRKELMQKIGPHGIAFLPSAPEIIRNGDATYSYRQNSDFYYLTGFAEPEAILVLAPKRNEGEYILFNRVRDPAKEIWDGPRAGQEGACKYYRADQAFPIGEFKKMLAELLVGREAIHYPLGVNPQFDKSIIDGIKKVRAKIRTGLQFPFALTDVTPSLHEMRLFKSPAEIAVMRQAVEISAKAHLRAMKVCKPNMHEYELEAEILYEFGKHGARYPAYNSIVGAGRNTCILHYIDNSQKIMNGDLVLIDAGAEYQNYASDITRTFPANGRFSSEQKEIYQLVLESQLAAIKAVKPGVPWTAPQDAIVKIMTQGLVDLKILKGNVDSLIEQEAYFPFYMHRSGHWLGLDVHDVGRYRVANKWRKFESGMTFTIEPGIYISEQLKVPKRWHQIGVRIEDDILVTDVGCDVLSHMIPKQIHEIETIMA